MLTRSIVVIRKAAFVRDSQGTHVEAASLTASVRDSYGGRVGAASLTAKSRSRHCAEPVEQVGPLGIGHRSAAAELPHCVDPPRADNVRLPARARPTTKTLERAQPAIVQRPRMKASVLPVCIISGIPRCPLFQVHDWNGSVNRIEERVETANRPVATFVARYVYDWTGREAAPGMVTLARESARRSPYDALGISGSHAALYGGYCQCDCDN